jgi:hypothetical protein
MEKFSGLFEYSSSNNYTKLQWDAIRISISRKMDEKVMFKKYFQRAEVQTLNNSYHLYIL